MPYLQNLNDGRTRHVDDEWFFRRDGSSFPVAYTISPVQDSQSSTITRAVFNFRDISDKLRQ